MPHRGPANPERSFGVSVGAMLMIIGALLAWRGRVGRAEIAGSAGAVLLLFGLLAPSRLAVPSAWWWRFSRALGAFNARVLLTVLFVVVLLPLGLVWRILGNDPLSRRRDRWPGWTRYPDRYRDRRHYARMY